MKLAKEPQASDFWTPGSWAVLQDSTDFWLTFRRVPRSEKEQESVVLGGR